MILDRLVLRNVAACSFLLGLILVIGKLLKIYYNYALYLSPLVIIGWFVLGTLILVGGFLGFAKIGRSFARHQNVTAVRILLLGGLVAIVLSSIEVLWFAATGDFEFVTLRFFQIFRHDILFIAGFAGIWTLLLTVTRAWLHKALTAIMYFATALLLFVAILELVFYLQTGNVGDWYLLQYAAIHASYVAPAVVTELAGLTVVFILLPILITGAAYLLSNRKRKTEGTGPEFPVPAVLGIALLVLMCLVLPSPAVPRSYQPFQKNIFAKSVVDAAGFSEWASLEKTFPDAQPLFDSRFATVISDSSVSKPNVVLFILESVRAQSIQPYDYSFPVTPYLDSLATRSAVASQMYANLPYTSDALVSLLYGIYPQMTPRTYFPDIAHTGLPNALRQVGYSTAFFTSATLSPVRGENALLENLGFEVVVDEGMMPQDGFERVNYSGYEDNILLQPVQAWINRNDSLRNPFFLTLLNQTTHHDYTTPSTFATVDFVSDDEEFNAYLNSLRYLDKFVERFIAELDISGVLQNTVIVFVGDHGEAFGEHGVRFHGTSVFNEAMRIPLMIYDGRGELGTESIVGLRQQIDIFPTLLEITGTTIANAEISGRSVLQSVPPDRKLFLTAAANQSLGMIRGDKKYIYDFRRSPTKVFDLAADPYEQKDLSATYSDKELEEVELELLSWQSAVNRTYRMTAPTE